MKQIIFAITLFSIFAILSADNFAQNNAVGTYSAIKTEKGMAIFYRNQSQDFSLLVEGKNPRGKENNPQNLSIETDSNAV